MAESPRLIELQEKFEDNPRRFFASLANEYRKAGDLQRAISICRIYLEKQPGHTAGHVILGQALYGSGKIEEAAESFKTVLGLDPENLIALKCIGDIAQTNGNLELAHENFRQVLTADPRDHDASGKLKAVERALKVAALASADEWIPPRSDEFTIPDEPPPVFATEAPTPFEFVEAPEMDAVSIEDVYEPGDFPQAAPDGSPHQSLEVDNLPALESPVAHEDIPEDDFVDTLLPSSETEHHPVIAEPVAMESAEESLAVPDLMEEADILPAIPSVDGAYENQYRTAEFSLPNYGSNEPETGETSVEMESEAEALMDEAEQQGRTGEYSLSSNTAEWNRESAVTDALTTGENDHIDEMAGVEPAGPFITETVAELYLQQGFTGEALLVYRQLARSKPKDERIGNRIAELEQRLADEHVVRQAALAEPEPPAREIHSMESVVFDITPPEPVRVAPAPPPPIPLPVTMVDEPDDWFASAPVPPARSRQTVQEFFAVLGRAKAEVRLKPERSRVSADDIRAAAEITAGFGAFGMEPAAQSPRPISSPIKGESDPQEDVRRFRAWLDGLSDS
ncbi:MAG: tetratricopeptide repeat protein [Gemmatimonadaceae bacterium]|nr:tetratricopeptide repeat protein [Gemmatimonadaceae bacterium]